MTSDGRTRQAQELLATGQWEPARQVLSSILAAGESAEVLDAMGAALWWLGHVRDSLDHRERAYAAYLAGGRHAEAAIVALDVSVTYLSNLDDPAVARGWIARAKRAADLSGEPGLPAWMWLMDGYTSDDPVIQRELLTRALRAGRELGDIDLELAAMADLGLALVSGGDVSDGMKLLDEAMAGTLGGECERLETVVWISCSMLEACRLIGDQHRAAQWCGAAERFADRYGSPFLQATCRSHYGRVLVDAGDWPLAESELLRALSLAIECSAGARAEALLGLAELRLRQGDVAEAERLVAEAGPSDTAAIVTAEVLMAGGHHQRAASLLRAELSEVGVADVRRPSLGGALVDACLAAGDVVGAVEGADMLEAIRSHQHPQSAAVIDRASGLVAAALGQLPTATQRMRRAIAEFASLGLPYQAARVRFELAAQLDGPDPELAVVEAGRALATFERLGARLDAAAAAGFLRRRGVPTRPGPRQLGSLSRREMDVLALMREGLTNPQIAERLFISPKTVAHHVSSILTKLDVRTRAQAAAFAAAHLVREDRARNSPRVGGSSDGAGR